ncbi:MAG: SusC/RagA family TonB-linked outer membrane protein, partial [Bacteroidaceae bacterium]|nr:SusC/RagA family TonB-linked outer membrane protein [Bacteroidaceae bacterium]
MHLSQRKTALLLGLCAVLGVTGPQLTQAAESNAESAQQQTKKITGVVRDSHGPLIGAAVIEKGTTNGAVTNMEGQFSLNVQPNAVLEVSYLGYVTREVSVGTSSQLNIVMKEDRHNINEVVVIGYGTQRREAVTGSVANIGGEKLNQIAATNAAQALQGRIAGVLMTQTSTQPGEEMQIRIRGQRSLSASNDPLIVLDGIPFMGNLNEISPSNIKSMDILKDAASTAIYGSRGANGVIIITTEKGTMGTPAHVSYNSYVSFRTLFHKYPMMDGPTYVKMREAAKMFTNTLDERNDVNTDWQDMFYQTGISHKHDVTVSGGTTGGSYSFGAGYFRDEAVVPTQSFDRISVRGNFDQKVGEYFRFGLTTNNSYRIRQGSQVGLYGVLSMSPIADPYNEDGSMKRFIH